MIFSNSKVYDNLKIASIIVSALGTLYGAIALAWGLPYGEQVGSTALAIVTFLGTFLKASSDKYKEEQSNES